MSHFSVFVIQFNMNLDLIHLKQTQCCYLGEDCVPDCFIWPILHFAVSFWFLVCILALTKVSRSSLVSAGMRKKIRLYIQSRDVQLKGSVGSILTATYCWKNTKYSCDRVCQPRNVFMLKRLKIVLATSFRSESFLIYSLAE